MPVFSQQLFYCSNQWLPRWLVIISLSCINFYAYFGHQLLIDSTDWCGLHVIVPSCAVDVASESETMIYYMQNFHPLMLCYGDVVLHIHCLEASCIFAFSDWRSIFTHRASSQNLNKNLVQYENVWGLAGYHSSSRFRCWLFAGLWACGEHA